MVTAAASVSSADTAIDGGAADGASGASGASGGSDDYGAGTAAITTSSCVGDVGLGVGACAGAYSAVPGHFSSSGVGCSSCAADVVGVAVDIADVCSGADVAAAANDAGACDGALVNLANPAAADIKDDADLTYYLF